MALTLQHQNKVQYLVRLRNRCRAAEKRQACRLAWRILQHLAAGDVTLAQMQNAWNMTPDEWTAKAALLQVRADKWTAILAAEASTDAVGVD